MKLNETAIRVAHELTSHAQRANVVVSVADCGTTLVDCGVEAVGGLAAGCRLAEVCLAGLGEVRLDSGPAHVWRGPWVTVSTDQPVAACMASQYAGWPLNHGQYFAMGSGPMRAARGREPLFDKIGYLEQSSRVVGVLETGMLPGAEVCRDIARQCQVETEQLLLLVAHGQSGGNGADRRPLAGNRVAQVAGIGLRSHAGGRGIWDSPLATCGWR